MLRRVDSCLSILMIFLSVLIFFFFLTSPYQADKHSNYCIIANP